MDSNTPTPTPKTTIAPKTPIATLASILALHLVRDPRAFIRALLEEAIRPFGTLAAWGEHIEATRPGWGPERDWSFPDPRGLHEDDALALTAALTLALLDDEYRDDKSFGAVWMGITTNADRSGEWGQRAVLIRTAAELADELVTRGLYSKARGFKIVGQMLESFMHSFGDCDALAKCITARCEEAQHAACDAVGEVA
ncbi:MAG: hypothetical protein MUE69_24350 [Myxococcota bacterium]|jgi:hypothetical protein|nr:hypothetical protein [Myxococcota bacterium]